MILTHVFIVLISSFFFITSVFSRQDKTREEVLEIEFVKKTIDDRKDNKKKNHFQNQALTLFESIKNQILDNRFSVKKIKNNCQKLGFQNSKQCLTHDLFTIHSESSHLSIPHYIALLRDEKALNWFLKVVKDYSLQSVLDNKDKKGWTASHFAALHKSDTFLRKLEKAGANQDLKNSFQGTPRDVYDITHFLERKSQRVHIFDDNQGHVVSMDGESFFKETGVNFVERQKIEAIDLFYLWSFDDVSLVSPLLAAKQEGIDFEDETSESPNVYDDLYIKKIQLSDKSHKEIHLGYGLFTSKEIAEGTIITDYQGLWFHPQLNHNRPFDEHSTYMIDGSKARGYASFAMDCSPNSVLSEVKNVNGHGILQVLVSLENIEKDGMICFNYQSHPIKKGRYVELESEKVNRFIKDYGSLKATVDYLFDEIQGGSQVRSSKIISNFIDGSQKTLPSHSNNLISTDDILGHEAKRVFEKLNYIFITNAVLIRIALEGYIKKSELKEIREGDKLKILSQRINDVNRESSFFSLFGEKLIDFLEILERMPEGLKSVLLDFLLVEKQFDSTALKVLFIFNFVLYFKESSFAEFNNDAFEYSLYSLWVRIWSQFCKLNHVEDPSFWDKIWSWLSFRKDSIDSEHSEIPKVEDIYDCLGFKDLHRNAKDL